MFAKHQEHAGRVDNGFDSDEEQHAIVTSGESCEWSAQRDAFPMAIVWSTIPVLSWLVPPVGHMGIVSTDGVVHDFAGPYYIHTHRRRTAFGSVMKYKRVSAGDIVVPPGETPQSA